MEETVRTRFIIKAIDMVVMGWGLFILLRLMFDLGKLLLLLVVVMVMIKMLGLLPIHTRRFHEGGRCLKSLWWLLLFMFLLLLSVPQFFRQRASTMTVPMP